MSARDAAADSKADTARTQRLVAMGEMAAALAHEIRNPLGGMELNCSLLKRDLRSTPASYELAQRIHDGIRSLERVIANCLQFARDIRPAVETVPDIGQFVSELIQGFRCPVGTDSIETHVLGASHLSVRTDPSLLEQVLQNVWSNALQATALAGRTDPVEVRCSSADSDKTWCVTVADHGVGMSEDCLKKMWDPFFTTKRDGTGLGLAIVHGVAKALGGTISVESTEGAGTVVALRFPVFPEMVQGSEQ